MADPDLRQLMLDAEQQSSEISSMGVGLPRLDRNLRQVCEASRDLWSRLSQTMPTQNTDAHILLGSKGVDLSQLSQKLESLSSRDMLAPLEPTPDTVIDTYVTNETQNTLLNIVEECRSDMSQRSEMPSNVRSLMSSIEMAYAGRIIDYNKTHMGSSKKDTLVHIFREISLQFNDKKIPELWDCLDIMMHLPVELTVNSGDPIKCRNSPLIQAALIRQARKFLQNRYKLHMQTVVANNLQRARTGGMPSTFPLVRGFVALQESSVASSEDGQVDGQPVWSLVYYCLRCGDAKAALYCAQQAGHQLQNFCPFLEELSASQTGELSDKTVDNIKHQFRRVVANCNDPYKKAVYCLLGACEVREDFPEVLPTAEDYLWFKLGQIRIPKDPEKGATSTPTDMLTYNHLQSLIVLEYGESYYNAKEQPYLYANMLLLTGQFESAIDFLARTGIGLLKPHAVHMALALHEAGLLAIPTNVKTPLISTEDLDPSPSRRLNLARLILTYCRKFEQTNLQEVLNYYYFFRELKGPDGTSFFKHCICDLALNTSAFTEILGSLAEDGTRLPGLIDTFLATSEECKNLVRMVAESAEQKALLEQAIPLYELCGDHEGALRIVSVLVGQVLPLESQPGSQSDRDRLANTARRIEHRYRGYHLNCPASTSNNFTLLCQLLDFFDYYNAQDYQAAKEVLAKTRLLPSRDSEIEEYTKNFRQLDDSIMRNFPAILLAIMRIFCAEYGKLKSSSSSSSSRDQQLEQLRTQAQAVTAFSATLPYNMPGDTNSMLVQLMMHMN
ncbi:hypothetical protein B566_EDAN008776 [Ephemera danica]|nr:hypothetical protein B566_EDAN008776 [Ephemera danica]